MQQFESQFLFHPPQRLPLLDPSRWPEVDLTNLWIDGSLHIIVIRSKQARETPFWCVFFHGNGMVAEECTFLIEPLVKRQGWNLVIVEYRGYGHSNAALPCLCKESILEDGELAVRFLTETCRTNPQQIILWGYSLGGAVATHVARMASFHCLVLVGTFSSLLDVAKDKGMCNWITGPLLSFYYKATESLDTCQRLKTLQIPVIMAHAFDDQIVPAESARRNLQSVSHKSKWLVWSQTGSHSFFPVFPWFLHFIENVPKPILDPSPPTPTPPPALSSSSSSLQSKSPHSFMGTCFTGTELPCFRTSTNFHF